MKQRNSVVFLSGRLTALVVLLAFQIGIVRLLAAEEYGRYALVFAWASLMQSVISFGIPRLIPKYISQAGWSLDRRTVRRIALGILGLRLGGSAVLLIAIYAVAQALGWIDRPDAALLASGALYILVSLVQVDGDAMAQALSLQSVSRMCTVGEAVVRLVAVLVAALAFDIDTAAEVLAISLVTSGVAAAILIRAVLHALSAAPEPGATPQPLDRREFMSVALGGYASTMAWFASSPAVVRLIAGRLLGAVAFAGFSFAQTLVLSFQRYTPGMLLFPFIEPNVMAHHARTGDRSRLAAALSLVTKIDLVVIGAAMVGTAVAGQPIVELMTGGRYGAYAYALPWLLAYVVAASIYRAFEIVAVAIGASSALIRPLASSLVWLALAVWLTGHFGLVALLVCPVGDSLTRLAMMRRAMARADMHGVIDMPVALGLAGLALLCGAAGLLAVRLSGGQPFLAIAIGTLAASAYLLAAMLIRPLRLREAELVLGVAPPPRFQPLRRYARA